jgi:nucleoside-diphosphate-sugar epimerase
MIDISKAKIHVGYAPTRTIEQGMEEAIEWYVKEIDAK